MQQPIRKKYFKIDDGFRPEDAAEYDLFIELSSGMTSFALVKTENSIVAGIGIFENPLFQVIEEFPWIKNDFHITRISLQNNRYTLVPEQLFVPEKKETFADFLFDKVNEKESVEADFIEQAGIYIVYSVPEKFIERLNTTIPNASVSHAAGVLLRSYWPGKDMVFLNVRHESMDIVVFIENRLVFCNSFYFQAPEDLVYYLMFVMDQLKLDHEKILLMLSGNIEKETPLYELIERYTRRIEFISAPFSVSFSTLFDDMPRHQVFSLVNISLCG